MSELCTIFFFFCLMTTFIWLKILGVIFGSRKERRYAVVQFSGVGGCRKGGKGMGGVDGRGVCRIERWRWSLLQWA